MDMNRRNYLTATLGLATAGLAPSAGATTKKAPAAPKGLPDKAAFDLGDVAYLNSGTIHPFPASAVAAREAYTAARTEVDVLSSRVQADAVREKFAKLINASADEIAFTQSTTMGEQQILGALGLPDTPGHIVTDTLHFFGSFPLYQDLEKRGCEVTWLRPESGRISLEQFEAAIRPDTKLVSLSLVSTYNGFEHDLKGICEIAHARGAYVFADIIHAAGCVPIDVRATGVDFASTASYKWLMGDFGLGFIFARKDRLPELKRTQWGYYGISSFSSHVYPFDSPGDTIADYAFQDTAAGYFHYGTYSHTLVAQLNASLDYIHALGVENIQAHATQMTDYLKEELPKLGFEIATPFESKTPLVTAILEGAYGKLNERLEAAKVKITLSRNRFRVCPSVFNDMDDIERLLAALR